MKNWNDLWPVLQALAKEKKLTELVNHALGVVGIIEPMLADPMQARNIENILRDLGFFAPIVGANSTGESNVPQS